MIIEFVGGKRDGCRMDTEIIPSWGPEFGVHVERVGDSAILLISGERYSPMRDGDRPAMTADGAARKMKRI